MGAKWVVTDESQALRLTLPSMSLTRHHIQDKVPSPYSVAQASFKLTILQPQSPMSEVI